MLSYLIYSSGIASPMRNRVIAFIFLINAVGLLSIFFFSRTLSRSILKLRDVTDEIAGGNLDAVAKIASGDEIGELSRSCDRMAQTLKTTFSQLRASEDKFGNLMESTPIGIGICNGDGIFLEANPALRRIFGYNCREDFLKVPAHSLFRETAEGENFLKLVKAGAMNELEAQFRRKDGQSFWGAVTSAVQAVEGGTFQLTFTVRDITVRKQTEEALQTAKDRLELAITERTTELRNANELLRLELSGRRQAEDKILRLNEELERRVTERTADLEAANRELGREIAERKETEKEINFFASVIRNIPDAICSIDLEGSILSWNRGAEVMLGYTRDEIIGKPLIITMPREIALKELDRCFTTLSREGSFAGYESVRLRKDGSRVPVEIATIALTDGGQNITGYTYIMRDITERRQAEEEQQENEKRYKRLIESVTDYIYTVQVEDGRPVATSHGSGCIALTGYMPEEYDADPFLWFRMIHEADRNAVMEQSAKVLSGKILPAIEHRLIHKDGSVRWVRNKAVPRYDERGRLAAYDGLVSDITDRKRVEEQLYQSQKMESIGRMAGGVAHDFNNYLTAIIGFSETLMRKLKPEDLQYKILDKINNSALKAADVTRQLLAFSRKQLIEPQILDLNKCIENVQRMLERLIGEDIDLVTVLPADIGMVKADPTQIEQIIVNLAVNSRDAMPNGGKLTLETQNVEIDEKTAAQYAGIPPGLYVALSVSDTGAGIPDDIMPFIFDPFFTTKEKGKGTGLGLSTVYGIVELHKGKILAFSEEGKGTAFRVYLPRVGEKAEETTAEPNIAALPTGSETVLVVEDEEIVRDFAVQTLRMQGYTVFEAGNGRDALVICRDLEKPVDLIMTDVVMPNMNGRELAAQLRNLWKGCKVLYMSGYTEDIALRHQLQGESADFIKKPFNTVTLLNKVREVLDGKGGA